MAKTHLPLVEVIAPDGSKEYWAAAVAYEDAVAAVKKLIPSGYKAELSILRPIIGAKLEGWEHGEVRKVEPMTHPKRLRDSTSRQSINRRL